jgi:hypothetical protein
MRNVSAQSWNGSGQQLPAGAVDLRLRRGDLIRVLTPSGGGFGNVAVGHCRKPRKPFRGRIALLRALLRCLQDRLGSGLIENQYADRLCSDQMAEDRCQYSNANSKFGHSELIRFVRILAARECYRSELMCRFAEIKRRQTTAGPSRCD